MNRHVFGVMSVLPVYLRTHHANQQQVTITSYFLYLCILTGFKRKVVLPSVVLATILWGL